MNRQPFNYSYSLLNNLSTMLATYNFIHSEQAKNAFVEMANSDFDLDFAEMEQENAEILANLLKTSQSLLFFSKFQPEITTLLPKEVLDGVTSINLKLQPLEEYIVGIANGTMTNAEAEHKLLSWGCQKLNDDYLMELAEDL